MDGERLKKAREDAGLSQDDLSKKTGVTQGSISSAELGKRKPRPATVRKLAAALGVEPEWLMGEGPEEGPDTETVLLAMIEGREARLREAIGNDEINMEMAISADDLYRDVLGVVPMLRMGRGRIYLALDGLKATVDKSYDAAVRKLTGRRASIETIHGNTQTEGGQRAEVKSA